MPNNREFYETEQEWFELLTRVLRDFVPVRADIAYLYAQTADHQLSVLNEGVQQ